MSELGPEIGSLPLLIGTLQRFVPREFWSNIIHGFLRRLFGIFTPPIVQIMFDEFSPDSISRNKAYSAIEVYLGTYFSDFSDRLKASSTKGSRSVSLSMGDNVEIMDIYKGIKVWWMKGRSNERSNNSMDGKQEGSNFYMLTFHRCHRSIIAGSYLNHVLSDGKAIAERNRPLKLYTNVRKDENWNRGKKAMWTDVLFEHPAKVQTLAMDPIKKNEIFNDLTNFTQAKEYYAEIGKAWRRGYLLYGPPGTGKSTMIAAMANFIHYDVYHLDLTIIEDNTELCKVLMEISERSIVVIEDIDCLLGSKRGSKKLITDGDIDDKEEKRSKVTLSGLVKVINGLWSACGGERIIVFTTNNVHKLDPALIKQGRMDKQIEMSYCCFESFKVLAKNYLNLDSHYMFGKIKELLEKQNISPADIADELMPKSANMSPDDCLINLFRALNKEKNVSK